MEMDMPANTIAITQTTTSRLNQVNWDDLPFGLVPGDHMVQANYHDGQWYAAEIKPFHDLQISPFALVFHYGQAVFEGLKAFRQTNGDIVVFRPSKNFERLNKSLHRMAMPVLPRELFMDSLMALLELDRGWVPQKEGYSLYIRPLVFATENRLGVKISSDYKFFILTSPVGPYYPKPLRVRVETKYVRAAIGGVGYAKCAGNYGAAFYPAQLAKEAGYDQVMWTDSKENRFIEESGTMNIFLVEGEKLITPPLSSSILAGVTRDSIIQLAPELQLDVEERRISVEELEGGLRSGKITEAFGAGTAAVVAPIETVGIEGRDYDLSVGEGTQQERIKKRLSDIRMGRVPDQFGWNEIRIPAQ